ncbi:MAG: hypothetical protein JNM43_21340 [Planctomycetaceae bacterium]|nr:hypothetical protein [Planctomycetaceae bacterium]
MIPFEDIVARLMDARDTAVTNRVRLLQKLAPQITRQIVKDRGPSGPTIFWGNSGNVDELAHAEIVDPAILIPLLQLAGQPANSERPHAGIQHTYGYLFSTIQTPFGKKRDRWTSTSLESALGLHHDTLSPVPAAGTLLANATWVAGQIAFAGSRRLDWMERCLRARVAPELLEFSGRANESLRLIESIKSPGSGRQLHLLTDLVRTQANSSGVASQRDDVPWLLVYSIHEENAGWPQLITMFTVKEDFVTSIELRARTRKRSDIRLRYNATVPGIPQHELSGTVKLLRGHRKDS